MLIYQQAIRGWIALKNGDCSLGSPDPADERSDQQSDDAEVRDEKCEMMFTPRPARERGDSEIRPEQDEPEIKPWRSVNVRASDLRIETRFVNRSCDRGDDQDRKQNDRELERGKKAKQAVTLPGGPGR